MAARRRRNNPYRSTSMGNTVYEVERRPAQGNTALQPEPNWEEVPQPRTPDTGRQVRVRKPVPKVVLRPQQGVSLAAVAGFLIVALLAVGVLSSYIQLNNIYANTVTAQETLTDLESTRAKLEAEDEEIFDSETLNHAAEKAGLTKPAASQQVYLELSDPDNTVVYQHEEESTGWRGCWKAVQSFFTGIGAYFS